MEQSATPSASGASNATCAACGAPFRCGRHDPAPCWCARDVPAVVPVPEPGAGTGCLCPPCLHALVARRQGAPAD